MLRSEVDQIRYSSVERGWAGSSNRHSEASNVGGEKLMKASSLFYGLLDIVKQLENNARTGPVLGGTLM